MDDNESLNETEISVVFDETCSDASSADDRKRVIPSPYVDVARSNAEKAEMLARHMEQMTTNLVADKANDSSVAMQLEDDDDSSDKFKINNNKSDVEKAEAIAQQMHQTLNWWKSSKEVVVSVEGDEDPNGLPENRGVLDNSLEIEALLSQSRRDITKAFQADRFPFTTSVDDSSNVDEKSNKSSDSPHSRPQSPFSLSLHFAKASSSSTRRGGGGEDDDDASSFLSVPSFASDRQAGKLADARLVENLLEAQQGHVANEFDDSRLDRSILSTGAKDQESILSEPSHAKEWSSLSIDSQDGTHLGTMTTTSDHASFAQQNPSLNAPRDQPAPMIPFTKLSETGGSRPYSEKLEITEGDVEGGTLSDGNFDNATGTKQPRFPSKARFFWMVGIILMVAVAAIFVGVGLALDLFSPSSPADRTKSQREQTLIPQAAPSFSPTSVSSLDDVGSSFPTQQRMPPVTSQFPSVDATQAPTPTPTQASPSPSPSAATPIPTNTLLPIPIVDNVSWVALGQGAQSFGRQSDRPPPLATSGDGKTVVLEVTANVASPGLSVRTLATNNSWVPVGGDIISDSSSSTAIIWSIALSSDTGTVAYCTVVGRTGLVKALSFSSQTARWQQLGQNIAASVDVATGDGCILDLSSDGGSLAVGETLGSGSRGSVRVFVVSANTWTQRGIPISGQLPREWFGWSVSLSGDGTTVAIGAVQSDVAGRDAGVVRVYSISAGGVFWIQQGLDIEGEAPNDGAGWSMSLSTSGSTVAVGSVRSNQNGPDSGQVRVFDLVGSSWEQIGASIGGDRGGDMFGYSTSLSTNGRILGVSSYTNSTGQADYIRLFQYNGNTLSWEKVGSDITMVGGLANFASSVVLADDGQTVAIRASPPDRMQDSDQVQVFAATTVQAP